MKLKKLNHLIQWTSDSQNLFDLEVKFSKGYILKTFCPKFNVQLKNEQDQILYENNYANLSENYRKKPVINYHLFQAEIQTNLRLTDPDSSWIPPRDLRNWYGPYEFINNFYLNFELNYEAFLSINNTIGFFKKLYLTIKDQNDNICIEEIFEIDGFDNDLSLNNLFNLNIKKITNNSNLIKLIIDKNFADTNLISHLICVPINDSIIDENNLKVKEIDQEVVFENFQINNFKDSDFIIIPLTNIQFEIFNFLKSKGLNIDQILNINNQSFYKKVILNKNDFVIELNDKINVSYHGPFYLYNEQSYSNITWPENFQLINDIKYKKYFPIANKNSINYTKIINPTYYLSSNSQNAENILDSNLIGYKFLKDNEFIYKNINEDIAECNIKNIKNISIISVEKIENKYRIYVEITSNINADYINNISTEYLSNNFQLITKNIKNIEDIDYINFIIRYEYDGTFTNQESDRTNIIEDKILADINFNFNF